FRPGGRLDTPERDCRAGSVRAPTIDPEKLEPWPVEQVAAVIDALPERYRAIGVVAAGCGLRQGEAFGLRVRDVDFLRHRVHVEQQVKLLSASPTIAKPKGSKTRTVPLPDSVAVELSEHLRRYPAEGDQLIFTSREHKPLNRNYFNSHIWKPPLKAAGVPPLRKNGLHALRHFYASMLMDAGESAKAVAEYLGHADPGFTLRVYAHLFPSSEERARKAVDRVLSRSSDGPVTAPRPTQEVKAQVSGPLQIPAVSGPAISQPIDGLTCDDVIQH
ncbi:MAG: site-specific integrase, partial [Actinomycetota bacterium]|nr:site-specific integrase [Actinomycetota bacterium]